MDMVYIVEDDENIRELIVAALKTAGFATESFDGADPFFKRLEQATPALALLDIMLPKRSGMDILRTMRAQKAYEQIPVIFLTAKAQEIDKLAGLELGADDYITKPFSVLELIARVKTVLRRARKGEAPEPSNGIYHYKNLRIDTLSKEVLKDGQALRLTYKEYELLLHLYQNRGIVLSRDKLLETVWGYDFDGGTRTVDMHIRSLRQKLGDSAESPAYISTARGHGYKWIKGEEGENA